MIIQVQSKNQKTPPQTAPINEDWRSLICTDKKTLMRLFEDNTNETMCKVKRNVIIATC